MWLNIDKPLRTATLHAHDCCTLRNPIGTDFKPNGSLGRDGGWFEAADVDVAHEVAMCEAPDFEFIRCSRC